nr:hypothetical protein [Tanacetum cinerariifolium]
MLCLIETIPYKVKMFCSFVYAANSGVERNVWNDLCMAKNATVNHPWLVMGDFNVTMNCNEHSFGGSAITRDMQEFIDCVNTIEVEDICSSGLFYTWIKPPSNPSTSLLKKLDRVMVNEELILKYPMANATFLPYLVFDHSPVLITFPQSLTKSVKPFRVEEAKDMLKLAQAKLDADPHNNDVKKAEADCLKVYNEAVSNEEKFLFLFQKSEIEWMSCGDRNSKYFHKMVKSRQHSSRILCICDEKGNKYEGKEMAEQFVNHFKEFLSARRCMFHWRSLKDCLALAWPVVGEDVCKAVSVLYKWEATRIKKSLQKLVNLNQSAFIEGRLIQDNILITQELLKGYDRRSRPKRCCLKIDIAKADDTVDWCFLEKCLLQFGFHQKMVHWIMVCVTTAKFTINVNGKRHGYFTSDRGLRQGNPISPYLFTLVMEVFTLLMMKNTQNDPQFRYHKGCKELKITHLCFANDLLVLCHGDANPVRTVKRTLEEFSNVSGLIPSINKSTIFFGNVNSEEKQKIIVELPFNVGKLPVKYLGVPLVTKKLGAKECKQPVDKVKNKVEDWKNKYLSYASRMQLIASVLASIHTYWAVVFILPKSVVKDTDKVLKGFLWCKGELRRGQAKVSWTDICKPKSQGGLGFKPLGPWNEVLIMKNLWNIVSEKNSLWVKWVNVIKLKGRSIWEIHAESNDSWMWKNLLSLREKCRGNIYKVIRNARDIYDERLGDELKIADLIEGNKWKWPDGWEVKFPILKTLQVPMTDNERDDDIKWKDNRGNLVNFSVKAVWEKIREDSPCVKWSKVIWFSQCYPIYAFILWMAVKGRLQTQDRVAVWNLNNNMKCPLCNKTNDSHTHLFFECGYSDMIWKALSGKMKVDNMPSSWSAIIDHYANSPCNNSIWSVVRRIVLATAVYFVCKERNNRLFTGDSNKAEVVLKMIIESIRNQMIGLKVRKTNVVVHAADIWDVFSVLGFSLSTTKSEFVVRFLDIKVAADRLVRLGFLSMPKEEEGGTVPRCFQKSTKASYEHFVDTLLYGREALTLEDSRSKSQGGRLKCYICQSEDHLKRNCQKNNRKKSTGYVKKYEQPIPSGSTYDDSEVMMVMSAQALLDWIMDSGCSYHMTPRFIPELKRNLISLGTLKKEGFTVKLQSDKVKVINGSKVVLSEIRRDYVYSLDGHAMAGLQVLEKQGLFGKKSLGSDRLCSFRLMGPVLGGIIMRFKHEAFGKFKEWKQLVENQTGRTVKKLRTYNEHMDKTLIDKVYYLLIQSELPKTFWAEATCTAAYLINRSPSTTIKKNTPMKMWSGHLGDYEPLRIFGYVAYPHDKQAEEEDTHEPSTYQEAVACEDISTWKAAMKEEMDCMRKNKTLGRADIGYNEVFSLVVRYTSIRFILVLITCKDYELEQLDLKTAFLHGNLEEVIHMRRFDEYMMGNGFKRSSYDSCIYYKNYAIGEYIYLLLYVDDMLIVCKSKAEIGSTKSLLKKEFDMKELGEAKNILGMEIARDRSRKIMRVSQSGMSKVSSANAVGSLMYLMVCTRPDIAYAVSVVSRYLANPGKNHWEAVKWILKYLRGTANVSLVYGTNHGNHVNVTGFVDSNYAKDPDKGRYITVYTFLVHGCVVSWKATLQNVVALSTIEAEYMALTEAVKEVIWPRGFLKELGVELNTVAG